MKMKITAMIAVLIILAGTGLAVKSIGNYAGRHAIIGDTYVLKQHGLLSGVSTFDNQYDLSIMPTAVIDGADIKVSAPIDENKLASPAGSYDFHYSVDEDTYSIIGETKISGRYVKSTLTVINKKTEETSIIGAKLLISSSGTARVLQPGIIRNESENFMVLMPSNYSGRAIGISCNREIASTGEMPLLDQASATAATRPVEISPGGQITFVFYIYPFDLELQADRAYPSELTALMTEPLIETDGSAETAAAGNGIDILLAKTAALSKA
ncbi:MAG: hypothetical protein V1911_03730, partial [Candidatus Micrarchaeota archaeon]